MTSDSGQQIRAQSRLQRGQRSAADSCCSDFVGQAAWRHSDDSTVRYYLGLFGAMKYSDEMSFCAAENCIAHDFRWFQESHRVRSNAFAHARTDYQLEKKNNTHNSTGSSGLRECHTNDFSESVSFVFYI